MDARRFTLAVLLLTVSSPPLAQGPAAPRKDIGYVEPSIATTVARARTAALEKLADPRCREIFTEFKNTEGVPLDAVLVARRDTAESLVGRMAFLNGSGILPCGRRDVFAFTKPGSMSVFLCDRFRKLAGVNAASAATLLIHEMLHSLGSGEAPTPGFPTAYEITKHVESRCGR